MQETRKLSTILLLEVYLSILTRKCGDASYADSKYREVMAYIEKRGVSDPIDIAVLHFSRDAFAEGLKWIEKGIEEKSLNTAQIKLIKGLDFFERDFYAIPGMQALLQRLDFPD